MANSVHPDQAAILQQHDLALHCLLRLVGPKFWAYYGTYKWLLHDTCTVMRPKISDTQKISVLEMWVFPYIYMCLTCTLNGKQCTP